jgi:transcriptional regulator GlxA family with amidase domain
MSDGRICWYLVIDATGGRDQHGGVADRTVVIVTFPGVQSLDVVGPFEVFAGARQAATAHGIDAGYRVQLATLEAGPVVAESGLTLTAEPLPTGQGGIDTLLLPGGRGVDEARQTPELVAWVRRTAPTARRVATVCTGAFLAAEAGLLDGRRVTTHWARALDLATDYPSVEVDADPIYLRDGHLWSSAGVTAGIDLALAMVEDDLGTDIAQLIARWLVMFLHRPGGQTQFATPVWVRRAARSPVREAQARVESTPGADHRVAALAASASMSERHFARVFAAEVGETPSRFVERVRTEAARRDLESTRDTLDVIARRCGFGTAETLRRTFRRRLHTSPDAYRRRFATSPTTRSTS